MAPDSDPAAAVATESPHRVSGTHTGPAQRVDGGPAVPAPSPDDMLGWYHLLFLLCMLMLARRPQQVLMTVAGFTLGHALTITAASLGLAGLPGPPVETAIALSIMIVAAEIIRRDRTTLTWHFPVIISALFGLLHGFGFASALRDIGLPQLELPWALLAFNLGIETGQLLFVAACAAVVLAVHSIARNPAVLPRWMKPAALKSGVG